MTTLLTVGNSEGSRRCDAKCHEAKDPDCDCVCGGRYHGGGEQYARERVHQDIKDGRFGREVQLAAEAFYEQDSLL
jgi:hypothetical protein